MSEANGRADHAPSNHRSAASSLQRAQIRCPSGKRKTNCPRTITALQ